VETREGELVIRYANLAKSLQVSPGDRVRRGQALGTVGSSAPDARVTGPFLYFEAFRGGARVALP
jgi:murein DD-endopeptidase MepM/ murein hydrolase activator NlpD